MKKQINEVAQDQIESIAEKCEPIDLITLCKGDDEAIRLCKDVRAYLMDSKQKEELLLLKEGINAIEENPRAFNRYAKIMNIAHPAYKYKFVLRKRSKEIFDRDKIKDRLRGEIARWANKERKELRDKIASFDPPLLVDEQDFMTQRLEQSIEDETERSEEILRHFDDYEVVITNHAHAGNYPAMYLTLRTDDEKGYTRHGTEHLRSSVPNFIWYESENDNNLKNRADMKIDAIIQKYDCIGDSIYFSPKQH